mmetsp:Transcript_13035/g.19769  ORF Transcript_13035/g.19769 Transcript_13035/m.19769 type:complete len:268 (+) Transcript_13035:115-918(+)
MITFISIVRKFILAQSEDLFPNHFLFLWLPNTRRTQCTCNFINHLIVINQLFVFFFLFFDLVCFLLLGSCHILCAVIVEFTLLCTWLIIIIDLLTIFKLPFLLARRIIITIVNHNTKHLFLVTFRQSFDHSRGKCFHVLRTEHTNTAIAHILTKCLTIAIYALHAMNIKTRRCRIRFRSNTFAQTRNGRIGTSNVIKCFVAVVVIDPVFIAIYCNNLTDILIKQPVHHVSKCCSKLFCSELTRFNRCIHFIRQSQVFSIICIAIRGG